MRIACALTDLDGTLLEHGGDLGPEAREAIARFRRRGVPVVPLTSKTRAELRELLAVHDLGGIGSFENGAGVLGPRGVELSKMALAVSVLAERLEELSRLADVPLTPVTALPTAELRRMTGLPEGRLPAMLAREFGLPFLAPEGAEPALRQALAGRTGLRLTRGGLFWHLTGDHGKEDAADLLLRNGLVSRPVAGFGDASNDAGFLALCDVAILIPGPTGEVDADLARAVRAGRVAPRRAGSGWAAAADALIAEGFG